MDLVEATGRRHLHRHPWELARAAFFLRVLRDGGLLRPDLSVLDVGSGDAWFAAQFAATTGVPSITCWDSAYASGSMPPAPHPAIHFVSDSPAETFQLALLLDVLEHVENDADFLKGIVEDRLAPDGYVLVSVPAWPRLYSDADRLLRHHRRYAPSRAWALMECAGLRVERSGGLFHSLLLPRALSLARERIAPRRSAPRHLGDWSQGPLVTRAVTAALLADAALSRVASRAGVTLPGLSWWALCRR